MVLPEIHLADQERSSPEFNGLGIHSLRAFEMADCTVPVRRAATHAGTTTTRICTWPLDNKSNLRFPPASGTTPHACREHRPRPGALNLASSLGWPVTSRRATQLQRTCPGIVVVRCGYLVTKTNISGDEIQGMWRSNESGGVSD